MSRNHFGYFKVEKFNDDEEARNRHLIYTHSVITNGLIVEPIFKYIVALYLKKNEPLKTEG